MRYTSSETPNFVLCSKENWQNISVSSTELSVSEITFVTEVTKRYSEDIVNLFGIKFKISQINVTQVADNGVGVDAVYALYSGALAPDFNTASRDAQLLLCLPECCRLKAGVVLVLHAAGEGHLAAVRGQLRGAQREQQAHLAVHDAQRHQHGGLLGLGGGFGGALAGARQGSQGLGLGLGTGDPRDARQTTDALLAALPAQDAGSGEGVARRVGGTVAEVHS